MSDEPSGIQAEKCNDPETFREALNKFTEAVFQKAIARAKEKGRPMDPWNHYEPEFIRGRLIEEIGEWLADFTKNDNEGNMGIIEQAAEHSELFDIVALACQLWRAHQ